MRELEIERAIYAHVEKAKQYLENVASYMSEQIPTTPITVVVGDMSVNLLAGQMTEALKEVDADLIGLMLMSEFAISQMSEDDDIQGDIEETITLPKTSFSIEDGQRYRANGKLLGVVANVLFEHVNNVSTKTTNK